MNTIELTLSHETWSFENETFKIGEVLTNENFVNLYNNHKDNNVIGFVHFKGCVWEVWDRNFKTRNGKNEVDRLVLYHPTKRNRLRTSIKKCNHIVKVS